MLNYDNDNGCRSGTDHIFCIWTTGRNPYHSGSKQVLGKHWLLPENLVATHHHCLWGMLDLVWRWRRPEGQLSLLLATEDTEAPRDTGLSDSALWSQQLVSGKMQPGAAPHSPSPVFSTQDHNRYSLALNGLSMAEMEKEILYFWYVFRDLQRKRFW